MFWILIFYQSNFFSILQLNCFWSHKEKVYLLSKIALIFLSFKAVLTSHTIHKYSILDYRFVLVRIGAFFLFCSNNILQDMLLGPRTRVYLEGNVFLLVLQYIGTNLSTLSFWNEMKNVMIDFRRESLVYFGTCLDIIHSSIHSFSVFL